MKKYSTWLVMRVVMKLLINWNNNEIFFPPFKLAKIKRLVGNIRVFKGIFPSFYGSVTDAVSGRLFGNIYWN